MRGELLRRRAARPVPERVAAGRAIAEALHELLSGAGRVAAYVGVGSEPPTDAVLAGLPEVLLPVLRPDGDLDWALGSELGPAARGLLEPTGPRLGVDAIASCDVVLVPALAVDRHGIRLGRGGGSYDRALPRATGLTVALVYDEELVEVLPHEPHDVAVAAATAPSCGFVRLGQ